jgi:Tol biopolymer transport system component
LAVDAFFGGNWSSTGRRILFVARSAITQEPAIWFVHADGSHLRQLPIPSCGGDTSDTRARACFDPSWSPDGNKIAFTRANATRGDIYLVNPDGSGLQQITRVGDASPPDWEPAAKL